MPTTDLAQLTTEATQANIANAPNIDKLTQLVAAINQNAYMSKPGMQQQLGVAQNMMAGNLDPGDVQAEQQRTAEQYGSHGFAVDSGAWQSALRRANNLSAQALRERGMAATNAMYANMPQVNAASYTASPELAVSYQANKAQQAQAAANLAEQARQFDTGQQSSESQFSRNLAQRANEAATAAAQAQRALEEGQRQFNVSQSAQDAQNLRVLQENARQANQNADLSRSQLAQSQSQFESTLGQRQTEQAADLTQQQAALYAQIYGTLPGYNQYGVYTGQKGTGTNAAAANGDWLSAYNQSNMDALNTWTSTLGKRG